MLQQRLITALADELGPRPATSTAEARAAALLAAQMRQAGLDVGVQTFAAAAAPTAGLGLLAAIGTLTALLGWWLPAPSLALAVLLLAMAARELRGPPILAAMLRRRPSQNVIGTRAAGHQARQRIVLLCHLDSPRIAARHGRWLRLWLLVVPIGLGLLAAVLALRIWQPGLAPLLGLPGLALLCGAGFVWRRERTAAWSHGAADAAAVATTLAVVADLPPSDEIELWVVALGAGAAAGAGLQALLGAYPFPSDETWFINLPWLGRGTLTVVAGEGLWNEQQPDAQLALLFYDIQSASAPLVQNSYRGERLDSARLLALGYRAISLVGLRADGTAAGFRHADDISANLDQAQLKLAQRILRRALERFTSEHSHH